MCPVRHAAEVSTAVQCESRLLAPPTEDDIKLLSSMKALIKGRETFPENMKHGAFDNIAYSMMTLVPAEKRMMDKVQPAYIPLKFQNSMLSSRISSVCGHNTSPVQRK